MPNEDSFEKEEELEEAMELYYEEQSMAIKKGHSTQYSLLLLIEGTEEAL